MTDDERLHAKLQELRARHEGTADFARVPGRTTLVEERSRPAAGVAGTPGKSTLVDQQTMPVELQQVTGLLEEAVRGGGDRNKALQSLHDALGSLSGTLDREQVTEIFSLSAKLLQPPDTKLPFRAEMERAFGMDFGDVDVHLGASGEMQAIGAHAVTRGNEITFASTAPPKELVAHELTHIVQQRRGGAAVQAKAIDTGERDALEHEADAVGARVAGGAVAGPITGSTSGTGLRDGDDKATDVFPQTTFLQVVGDRFQLTWKRVDKKLVCRVHYEGQAKASAPFLKDNAVELEAQLEDPTRKVNARVTRLTGTGVVVDVYGDGQTIGTFKDSATPTETGRGHSFSWEVGGLGYGAWVTMTIEGAGAGAGAGEKQGAAAGTSFVALDSFTLSAVRYGDSKSAAVTLTGGGDVPNPQTFEVPIEVGKLDHVAPKVVSNDGRTIKIDLNGDGKVDLTLVHSVREVSKGADGKNQLREHHFRRFDKDGVLIGDYKGGMLYIVGGKTVAIPKAQDEATNAPDVNKEAPVTKAPAQGDELGELPQAVQDPGGVIEMRIDGDGDRTKEMLLRFKGTPGGSNEKLGQLRIDLIQLSSVNASGQAQSFTFDVTDDAVKSLEPRISQVADGHSPVIIDMISSVKSAYGAQLPLKLYPPKEASGQRSYIAELGGKIHVYTFPAETTPENPLVKSSDAKAGIANISRFEVVLGEFGDRFWVMLEAQPGGGSVLSVAALDANGQPVAARGVPVSGDVTSFTQLNAGAKSFAIDLNKDGKPEIQIFDALSAPIFGGKPKAPLKAERDHQVTITGSAVGSEQKWGFYFRDGKVLQGMWDDFGKDTADKQAAGAASAVKILSDQQFESQTKDEKGNVAKEGDPNALLSRIAGALMASRQKAKQAGLISDKLFSAWESLSEELITLAPQIGANKVDAALQKQAGDNAATFYAELAVAAASESHTTTVAGKDRYRSTTTNKITGTTETTELASGTKVTGPGVRLPDEIRGGKWKEAARDFESLVHGLDSWIAIKLGKDSDEGKQQQYLVDMQGKLNEVKDKPGVTRVLASFQPDAAYNTNTKEWGEIPLMLFTWKENGKWYLRDVTNPSRDPSDDDVAANANDTTPPASLFKELDYARHFPKGVIHYQVPNGPGGQLVTTERKHWWEFLQWIGLGAAVIGISLATFGTGSVAATAAAVAFAASGVAGAGYAIGDLQDRAKHGELEPAAVVMDIAQIVAGFFTAGAAISGRIVAAAAQADMAAAKGVAGAAAWSGAWARVAQVSQMAYTVSAATAISGDVVNLIAMTADTIAKIQKIKDGDGSDADKKAAIAQFLAQAIVFGGIQILSIKGQMPEVFSGRPTIVIDNIGGIPVARANSLKIAGGKINAPGEANAQASARWQSHEIEEAAAGGNAEAKKLLDNEEFMKSYRQWMEQAEPKVVFDAAGKPKANFAKGKEPSPEIQAQIQKFVDTKGVGISLYEKAWANGDSLKKIEDAIAKKGGNPLDIQPGSKGWSEHRADIVKELGGGAQAEEMVARYERMKLGADAADPHAFLEQRARLRKMLPDTEVERIRGIFPEYEVYVTGGATQTAKPIKGDISDIDVIVVVPKGTAPELMAAIEQRARGATVRPDPEFIQLYGLPADKTIQVSAKVVTPEQFFGLTSATSGQGMVVGGKAPSPLNFTRIDVSASQMDSAVMKAASPKEWVDHLKTRLAPDAQIRLDQELNQATPKQLMDAYAGDIDLAIDRLSGPDGATAPAAKNTVEMFTKGPVPKGAGIWTYAADSANWQPARTALHDQLIAKAKGQAQQFADAVEKGEPTIYAMRGNTAAGKTRAVAGNVPELSGAMAKTKDLPHRSVNPDNFKADLIAATPGMTSTQVHVESSTLAQRLEKELLGMKTSDGKELASILIDKRLAKLGDVTTYADMAASSGRKFVLYDVDAPLEASLAGVLERAPGGADPLPPFDVVADGFKMVRGDRAQVIEYFQGSPDKGTYILYGTRADGARVEIASVVAGKLTVKDADLFAVATGAPGTEAEMLSKQRITKDVIAQLTANLPSDRATKVSAVLSKYEGWTWKAALDGHSVEKPPTK